nr:MAG TPA: hypothetical protein [Caudoviricetes sp.]
MIRMSKLINKKFLKEDWGDLIAISPSIRSSLKNRFGSRYSNKTFGKNSTVKVLHLSGKELYELLTAGEDNGRNNDILSVVIRYGQQDMILLINDSSSWKVEIDVRMADDLDDICDELSWQDRISLPNTVKSESGCVKLCNNLINFLYGISHLDNFSYIPYDKKAIAQKINFQVIYSDKDKIAIRQNREKLKNNNYYATVNNIRTPSNTTLLQKDLKLRLKNYIQSKLPQYDDVSKLPKDMKLFKENSQFKLFGCVYKYDDSETKLKNLLNTQKGYVAFENEFRYQSNIFSDYPRYIIFEIILNNQYQLSVGDIFFNKDTGRYSVDLDDLHPINELPEYIKQIKSKYSDEYSN